MKKILITLIILLAGCSGTEITLRLPSQTIPVGSTFTINVEIYKTHITYILPDKPWDWILPTDQLYNNVNDLYGVAFDLWYDPAIISLQNVDHTQGFLSTAEVVYSLRNATPGKQVIALSLEGATPGITGKGNILNLTFMADSPGTTTVIVHDLHLYDSLGNKIDASIIISNNGIITVQ